MLKISIFFFLFLTYTLGLTPKKLNVETAKLVESLEQQGNIKNFVIVMLENRAFDHLLGHLKQVNPEIDGLNGNESIPIDPTDPNSKKVQVSFDCPPDININPGHSIGETETEIWGSQTPVNPPPMNGFIKELLSDYSPEVASIVMKCYNSTTLSVLSTLATEYALFDRYYSSIPGPTGPNRMYFLSGTSYGAATNIAEQEIEGYPQRTFIDDLYEDNQSFKIYFSDFPTCLLLSRLREYPTYFGVLEEFLNDAASGSLPTFSWVEPRWFSFLDWPENDEHPHVLSDILSGNVLYGEFFLKEIYEAVRNSPQWNETALIITYDEHGGLYDHVPPPSDNIPNPDGKNSDDPKFKFDRLGLRIPHVVVSPWVKKGSLYHEPATNHYDHTSTIKTIRKMLSMTAPPLTKREEWAATYENIFQELSEPRKDCLTEIPLPPHIEAEWNKYIAIQRTPETPENIEKMIEKNPSYITNSPGLTELQQEILRIAQGVAKTHLQWTDISNHYEAGVFIRSQARGFLSKSKINMD